MSYRTLKRWIGETNFEVKCLILFGFGLVVLAVITILLYWQQSAELVGERNRQTGRLLLAPIILEKHWKTAETDENQKVTELIDELASSLKPEDLREYQWSLFSADPSHTEAEKRPPDQDAYEALDELIGLLPDGKSDVIHDAPIEGFYYFYGAIQASETCIGCHYHSSRKTTVDNEFKIVPVEEGELIGVVRIILPRESTEEALHSMNALVITAEMMKVVLSLVAIYLVIRYVITKPVLHLKKVSDAIAHGNLDMRADIRTGDEFEELSHAFNRMLRHLVTVQEELRELNTDLDGKVDELAHVNLRLYELNNLKNEFLATMSHELRTPLNSILGFSDVLSNAENLTDKQSRYVWNIQTSGKNLMTLINDILDLAKIESGKVELHIVEFKIDDLIERQVGTLIPLAEKKNIEMTCACTDGIPPLTQDAGKFQQILNNLLSNAIKFTPEGGRVSVRASLHDAETVNVIVEDTGVGIPLEDQEAIFEKFRQGRSTPGQRDAMTRQYEGTGLGLSIVKELCRWLGGEVLLVSEFGKGSTFTVRVPVYLEETEHLDEEIESELVGINRRQNEELGLLPQRAESR